MRNRLLLLPLVLPVLLLQSTDNNAAAQYYERGRVAMQQGHLEIAAMSFRKARAHCLKHLSNPDSTTLLSLLTDALQKADTLGKEHDKQSQSAARALLSVARRYIKKGWAKTARPYLAQIEQLDQGVGLEERRQVAAKSKGTNEVPEIHRFFTSLDSIWKLKGWVRDKDQIVAARSNTDEPTAILGNRSLKPGYRIEVELRIPDKVSRGGLYFGYRDIGAFHYLELGFTPEKEPMLDLYKWGKTGFTRLASIPVDKLLLQGSPWVPLILEVRDGEVCFAQKGKILSASFYPDQDFTGRIGLTATYNLHTEGPFRFRAFHLQEEER